jgi:hypothetical protein
MITLLVLLTILVVLVILVLGLLVFGLPVIAVLGFVALDIFITVCIIKALFKRR